MLALLLLALLAPGHATGPFPSSAALSSAELAATASTLTDAVREAPLIQFNRSDAPILLISAVVPADCSCRLGSRDVQYDSALTAAEVVWTPLLATNVISGIASVGKFVLDVDCGGRPEAAQRCRAEPEQLHLENVAGDVADGNGAVHATGSGVIEAAVQVTAMPAKDEAAHSKNISSDGMQSGAAASNICSGGWQAKWAARATLVLVTTGLTFAATS